MTIYERMQNDLQAHKNIVFLLAGEMGWETVLFSGAIRRYKIEHPNKNIVVATRKSRMDFYTGCVDEIYDFEIEGDYSTVTPRVNGIFYTNNENINSFISKNKEKIISDIINDIKNKYQGYKIFDTSIFSHRSKPNLDLKKNNYNFIPRLENKEVIENIIKQNNIDDSKIIMTMFSRHRIDIGYRNWVPNSEEKWNELYQKINDSGRFFTFISASSPSYIKPDKNLENIIDLEDYNTLNTSTIGLTIEALRKSNFSFGIITFGLLLSNCIGIQNIYFGDIIDSMIVKTHNFNNVNSVHICGNINNQNGCRISANEVFNNLLDFSNKFV